MKEGSVRRDRQGPFGAKRGAAELLRAATTRPGGPRKWKGGRGPRGSRPPAGPSALAPDARRPPGEDTGSPDRTSRDGGGRGPWHEERGLAEARAAAEWGLPGTWRASPRPGRGCGPSSARPRGGSGVSARRKLVPGRLDSGLLGSTPAASSQGRPREGRISGTAAAAPGGRGGGGGRLAPRRGERPGGPGLSPPQPPPLGAGGTRSGCARRGRKLSDLASAGRHSDSD